VPSLTESGEEVDLFAGIMDLVFSVFFQLVTVRGSKPCPGVASHCQEQQGSASKREHDQTRREIPLLREGF